MTLRQFLRAVLWLTNELIPAPAVRCAQGRDYDRAVQKAAPPIDVEEFDRIRAEATGEAECVEPAKPSIDSLFKAYWDARTPEVETQALDDLDRYYPDWRPSERPQSSPAAASIPGDLSTAIPPALDNAPAGVPPETPAGAPNLAAVIEDVLAGHRFWRVNAASIGCEDHCGCGHRPWNWDAWCAHVAPLIAERIEKASPPAEFTFGDLVCASQIIDAYCDRIAATGGQVAEMRALSSRLFEAGSADPNP